MIKAAAQISVAVLLVALMSCSESKPEAEIPSFNESKPEAGLSAFSESKPEASAPSFRKFLSKFPVLDMPFKYRPSDLKAQSYPNVDTEDTVFVDPLSMYYGRLKDTTLFFSVITMLPGDDFVPMLTTYDKQGHVIDSKMIVVRGCPGGPCINWCRSTTIIGKDFSIFCVDSTVEAQCNNLSNPIAGTDSLFCLFIKGKIDPSGRINMSEEQVSRQKQ